MSLYRRILQDLDIIEADVDRFCGSSTHNLESRIALLRHMLMFIIPYWDSRPGGTYSLRQLEDFKDGNEYIDYWLRKVICRNEPPCEVDECLMHTARNFYASSYLFVWENDWVKCAEGVMESLQNFEDKFYTHSIPDKFTTIKQGLGLLLCIQKLVVNWDFEKWEEIKPETDNIILCIKYHARRAMHLIGLLSWNNVEGNTYLPKLAEETASIVSRWRNIRNIRPLNITLEGPRGPEYETLVCITDDLHYLLIKLTDDFPTQNIRCIADQMDDFRCALSPFWIKIFVESSISYAIAEDIYTSAEKASHIISNLFTHDSAFHIQQKIAHIRDVAGKIYMKDNLTHSCTDDFFRCVTLILDEVMLSNIPTARYERDLSVLHTLINMSQVSVKLRDKYTQIQPLFHKTWKQLWSLCLRKSKSRKEFLTLSLDIFKDITADMLQWGDLVLELIESLVQMPKANELLHGLFGSLVTAEADNIFVKLVYSLEKNLVKTLTTEGVSDVVEDVDVVVEDVEDEVVKAAHNYILFFREFKNDACSSLKEGVEGFNASLRHAYDEYVQLRCMEQPMSELEFFDMLLNLTEFKESDTYNPDQIGVLHDDLSICFSFLQPYIMRHDKPEEVNLLRTQFTKLGRKVNNMIETFGEFPIWYNKLRAFYLSEEVKLIKEKLSKISSIEISKTEVEGSGARAENHMEKCHVTEHCKDEVSFEEEDSLREQLSTGSRSLEKISIVGMPGLGKTTLAMRLYKDCAKSFHAHAWCYVGQEFRRKELLQNIVGQISERPSSEINTMRVEDLATLLKQCLRQKRNYLIVLDDVWDVDAWDGLQICFPTCDNGGKVLITSRSNIVGEKICGDRNVTNVIKLNLLTAEESIWGEDLS